MSAGTVEATAWLQIEPEFSNMGYAAHPYLRSAKVVRMTRTRPRNQIGGTVLAKVQIVIPKSTFEPIVSARIELDESLSAVEVTQGDAT